MFLFVCLFVCFEVFLNSLRSIDFEVFIVGLVVVKLSKGKSFTILIAYYKSTINPSSQTPVTPFLNPCVQHQRAWRLNF